MGHGGGLRSSCMDCYTDQDFESVNQLISVQAFKLSKHRLVSSFTSDVHKAGCINWVEGRCYLCCLAFMY